MEIKGIYFVGKAGAGKTFCSTYLQEKYGFVPSKFAHPVYGIAQNYFNMKGKDRKLLQVIGTDVGREIINPNIWVERFFQDIDIVTETYKRLYNKEVKFVSDDCRFINEHQLLKEMGWTGIYLDVPDEIRIKRLTGRDGDAQVSTLNHISETGIDAFKNDLITVDSSGTLDQTYKNIEEVLSQFSSK